MRNMFDLNRDGKMSTFIGVPCVAACLASYRPDNDHSPVFLFHAVCDKTDKVNSNK